MDYARGLLEKYGWTEGKGLGKNETGISEAIKPSLKFDTTGIGHDHSDQFTFKWWEIAFNNAANRIEVQKSDCGGAVISTDETKDLHLSTKKPWTAKLKSENSLEYGSFVKTEKLTSEGELISLKKDNDPVPFVDTTKNLSDDELFRICGGRTAHKAARHGHKLVGKLARVIEQEKKLSEYKEAVPAVENTEADAILRKKKKKKRKHDQSSEDIVENIDVDNETFEVTNVDEFEEESKEVRKKKKKRKYDDSSDFVENFNVDNGTFEVTNADEIEEETKEVRKKKKRRKAEKLCEVEPEQQSDSCIVESGTVEVKRKKKKSKISEVNCTVYENPSDCIENPSVVGVKENTKRSKKKKNKL